MDPTEDPILSCWLDVLNHNREEDRARAVLADDVAINAYLGGKSGSVTQFRGIEDVVAWIKRAPKDLFHFEALQTQPCGFNPHLPAAERALSVRYRLTADSPLGQWEHFGDWILHIARDRIVAVHHAPDDLPED